MARQAVIDRFGWAIIATVSITIGAWAAWIARGSGSGTAGVLGFAVFFAAVVAIPTSAIWGTGLGLREKARRWHASRSCVKCGASLTRLECRWNVVVCKACGTRNWLGASGTTPAQLRTRETAFDGLIIAPGSRCPSCAGDLGGTRCEQGSFSCPECRVTHSAAAIAPTDFVEIREAWRRFCEGRSADAGAACERCGYRLDGLQVENDEVRCPECSHANALLRVRKFTVQSGDFDEFVGVWGLQHR
ncbi:MAG: hypothetical protein U0638_14575 [Phycisphaerales bacterium]